MYKRQILGREADLKSIVIKHPDASFFVAIGDNWIRHKVVENILGLIPNAKFANAIHPSSIISKSVTMGEGIVIMPGAIVNANSQISNHCIIGTSSVIEHDCKVGMFSTLAPNATLGGGASIGSFNMLGLASTVKHGISTGVHCVIGAGSVVLQNLDRYQVAYGIPAKVVRKRTEGEKYL